MLEIYTLASGSSGNCLLAHGDSTCVLVDAGISCRRIAEALNGLETNPADLSAVLITHEHTDHICGLAALAKQFHIPIYASRGTGLHLYRRFPHLERLLRPFAPGDCFSVGAIHVESFSTPHDAAQSVGYTLCAGGRKASVVTDLGHVTSEVLKGIRGANLLVAEANHDIDWLRSGPYPPFLQARILGDYGHLSNEAGAALVCTAAEGGATTVVLAHLSHKNNTPEQALQVVGRALRRMGVQPGQDVVLEVAPRSRISRRYAV